MVKTLGGMIAWNDADLPLEQPQGKQEMDAKPAPKAMRVDESQQLQHPEDRTALSGRTPR